MGESHWSGCFHQPGLRKTIQVSSAEFRVTGGRQRANQNPGKTDATDASPFTHL